MTSLVGHAGPRAAFLGALNGGSLHHAWLLAGPEGVGKAQFAHAVAARMLADASGDALPDAELDIAAEHPTRRLIDGGAHPDLRVLSRLTRVGDTGQETTARSITIEQVRSLQPMFATTPALGPRRVVIIDAIDDLERAGANALLKNLEGPPAGTIFLLVSHAPGRLLPTIRSRCRQLRFCGLTDEEMRHVLSPMLPETDEADLCGAIEAGEGAPGRALRFVGLDVTMLDTTIDRLIRLGDPGNAERSRLARALSARSAQPRYAAFLERAPAAIAVEAKQRSGAELALTLDAQREARELAGAAMGLSLDPQATVFEMAGILARLASRA